MLTRISVKKFLQVHVVGHALFYFKSNKRKGLAYIEIKKEGMEMNLNLIHKVSELWNLAIEKELDLQEIRLRVNNPIILKYKNNQYECIVKPTANEMMQFFQYLCQDSVYAYEEERCRGYMTVTGGHRIGFTGEVVKIEKGKYFVKYVCYMNIRIAHEIKNIGREMYSYIVEKDKMQNVLLVSPPGVGKTTLLRDLVRYLANEYDVGVVDERGEIAGACKGVAMLDCGKYADIVTGTDKYTGIQILLRTFAPRIIALDEIGNELDAEAILYASVCGCKVIATAHGSNWQDICMNDEIKQLMIQKRFQRIIFMSRKENESKVIVSIYNQDGKEICSGRELRAV